MEWRAGRQIMCGSLTGSLDERNRCQGSELLSELYSLKFFVSHIPTLFLRCVANVGSISPMHLKRSVVIVSLITAATILALSLNRNYGEEESPWTRQRLTCALDYHACGSLRAPPLTSALPCCNNDSYCYIRPPYFSQCRPRNELDSRQVVMKISVCAASFSNCSGDIPCCRQTQSCTHVTDQVALCLPPQSPHDLPPLPPRSDIISVSV